MFHFLEASADVPTRLNDPFCYEPHPLCVEAAGRVRAYLAENPLGEEVSEGKMMGVLVCRSADGRLGYLAAYSGQLGGREDWPWFVPAVFDYLQPDGYFKQEEAAISALNGRIAAAGDMAAEGEVMRLRAAAEREIDDYRQMMASAKARRDSLRGRADEATLIRESQFQKAELRRLKARWAARIAEAEKPLVAAAEAVGRLKAERRHRSDALQRWLFDRFVMLDSRGERRSLTEIFRRTPQGTPPSGAGECCAPKLLQYAFAHGFQPLSIAEFWLGRSPKMEVRHEGQYYPACRGKCKPILEWMLGGLDAEGCRTKVEGGGLKVVCSSSSYIVVDKSAGLLSVPGRTGEESVESLLLRDFPEVHIVHRLDQDTSGLLVVALSQEAYHRLQRQFLDRTVCKRYEALVAPQCPGSLGVGERGRISLPLRPDIADRPRQVVDPVHGKAAVTDYEVLACEGDYVRLSLTPHTGRTHQLRMHCAHAEGLSAPIVGDRLYGKPARRLCLHAAGLAFDDPLTGERVAFSSEVPF